MKGPSLHYDMRVLRGFCCDACGRTVHAPASATSRTCMCSDPPKFMRPLERPRTISPDVSRFISPVDPADEVEEEDIDEVHHVPHVPAKPAPPARFANRRKLYDDTVTEGEGEPDSNFGDGISSASESESKLDAEPSEGSLPESNSNSATESSENSDRDQQPSRRGRRGRGRQSGGSDGSRISGALRSPEAQSLSGGDKRSNDNQRSNSDQTSNRNPRGDRQPKDRNRKPSPPESRSAAKAAPDSVPNETVVDRDVIFSEDAEPDSNDTSTDSSTPPGEGRPRRSRRRGRRRGPRPEGGGE